VRNSFSIEIDSTAIFDETSLPANTSHCTKHNNPDESLSPSLQEIENSFIDGFELINGFTTKSEQEIID
jgi:hypothetical protein